MAKVIQIMTSTTTLVDADGDGEEVENLYALDDRGRLFSFDYARDEWVEMKLPPGCETR